MDTTVDVMEGMAIAFLHVASGGTWTSQTVDDDRFGVRHKSVTVAFVSCGGRPSAPLERKKVTE